MRMPQQHPIIRFALLFLMALTGRVAAQPGCVDPGSTMVWAVEGGPAEVYLMGSIHVGRPEYYPLEPVVEDLFRHADNLVFEVDPQQVNSPSVALDIQQRGMLPPGETLADHVSEETLARLQEVLQGTGMPVALIMQMQPWLVINVLSSIQIVELGLMPQLGTENYILLSNAGQSNILELESLEAQIGYLSSMNNEIYLRETLNSFNDAGSDMLERMLGAWHCADHEGLLQVLNEEYGDPDMDAETMQAMEDLEETLLYSRNEIMAERITEYLQQEGSYFVVVGSAHLLGERSILDILQQQGLDISPVREP